MVASLMSDALSSAHQEQLVLRQSKPGLGTTIAGLVLTAVCAGGIVRHDAEPVAWLGMIAFGVATALLLILRFWRPGILVITPAGFRKLGVLGTVAHRWSEVSHFTATSPGYVYPRRLPKQVVFVCPPTAPNSAERQCVLGRYGDLKPAQLADLMNRWRNRFR